MNSAQTERQPGSFDGWRHGSRGGAPIEGTVWFGPSDALYLHIKGAGTFNITELPGAIDAARREWFGPPARRGRFDLFSAADLRLLKQRVPEWADAIDAHLGSL